MVWLDRGTTRRLERGFADFEAWRDEVLEQEEQDAHKLVRQIAREEDWLRYGVTARRKRNVRRLGELHALRQQRRERMGSTGLVKMTLADSDGSGALVIVADAVSKGYGGPPVVRDFSTRIMRGDRVGIVGPNGAGKTTLLRPADQDAGARRRHGRARRRPHHDHLGPAARKPRSDGDPGRDPDRRPRRLRLGRRRRRGTCWAT